MKFELRRVEDFPGFNPNKFSAYPYDHFAEWFKPSRRTIKKVLKKAEPIDGICVAIVNYRKKQYVLGKYMDGFPRILFFNANKTQTTIYDCLYTIIDDPFGQKPLFSAWLKYEPGQYV